MTIVAYLQLAKLCLCILLSTNWHKRGQRRWLLDVAQSYGVSVSLNGILHHIDEDLAEKALVGRKDDGRRHIDVPIEVGI